MLRCVAVSLGARQGALECMQCAASYPNLSLGIGCKTIPATGLEPDSSFRNLLSGIPIGTVKISKMGEKNTSNVKRFDLNSRFIRCATTCFVDIWRLSSSLAMRAKAVALQVCF